MNNYAFYISEHNVARYVVEAATQREAEQLLNEWLDTHTEQVAYELDRSFPGWDIDCEGETDESPDITKGCLNEDT